MQVTQSYCPSCGRSSFVVGSGQCGTCGSVIVWLPESSAGVAVPTARPVAPMVPETEEDVSAAMDAARPIDVDGATWHEECDAMLATVATSSSIPAHGRGSLLTLFTLVLFVAFLLGSFSLLTLVLLVVALFIHELGHLAGMKLFGFRDLRMFFIPFFGAAVTGRKFNAPQWQQAVVSLMGPLPGMVLAVAVAAVHLSVQADWLTDAAIILLALNGLNLLPFSPLDGGRFLNQVLFSRNRVLEATFGLFAAIGLVAIGLLVGDPIIGGLGVVWLLLTPAHYRNATVAAELKGYALPRVETLSDLPQTLLVWLYALIRERYASLRGDSALRTRANLMRLIYEKAVTAPTSGGQTVGLLAAYFILPPLLGIATMVLLAFSEPHG